MSSKQRTNRRKFLIALGLGGAGAVAGAVAATATPAPDAHAKDQAPGRSRGYQATAHVHRYYRTARV